MIIVCPNLLNKETKINIALGMYTIKSLQNFLHFRY